ncbi:autotransporter outer membrane beta-barrel domain-containing protein [Mesorhizobium sp. YM1C-6-2]|uniref:autotransporter family protein n=1 Tax=Mesorhizobium sp. YM1C-6-2 TaxID=1827501 RepID=UPI000EF26161|nr:autotransporter outer membrane beta-barrel domain-containing protein [Mesorhizobium sp. YM1C-6-2]RLP28372.1 autotransporter outer membrane beta-barrel domain-containing protein [Mesorhizobium sp. YM1C-6-2]
MQTRSGGGASNTTFNRKYQLLAGVCAAALAGGATISTARAANFEASNETELYQAIAEAQASSDAASTITLTGNFAITNPPPSIAGKAITIETGVNTLTLASGQAFDVGGDATLTLSGNVLGSGVLNTGILRQDGGGQLVFDGVTGSGITRIDLNGGHTLVTGGSEITYGNTNATAGQMQLAGTGETASLTVSGQGTRLEATGTSFLDVSAGSESYGTITIEDGGYFGAASAGLRFFGTSTSLSNAEANLLVTGQGSTLSVSSFFSGSGTGYYTVRDGGQINVGSLRLGTAGASVTYESGWSTVEVVGDGSRWDSTGILELSRGTLSILDGGVMTGTGITIARPSRGATEFSALISGPGSELRGDTIAVGTGGKGILTIADDGKVVVGGGGTALVLGGSDADSDATLNIGGAAGEAAAAGTLEASAVTLAASGAINFNHTETGYVFDLPINGGGEINQLAGRTIFNADQTGFTGLASVYGGMLEVNGILGGAMDVRGGILAGIGSVGNTQNFAGGSIAPGINGIDTLTIDGNYTGNGGVLQIEAELGDDTSLTDLLFITGDSILGSGATQVFVTNLGGAGAETTGDGIKIVDVEGASAAGAFALGGPAIGGAYTYNLFQNDLTGTLDDGDWYLRADGLAPTVPVYENYPIVLLGLTELPTLQQRVGDRYWPGGSEDAAGYAGPRNLWTRIEGAHRHAEGQSTTGTSYDSNRFLLQAGIDGLLAENGSGMLVGGFNAQYGRIDADISSDLGSGDNSTDSYGVGATLTWYGNDGIYVDGQASVARLSSDLSADGVGELADGNDGVGYAFSIEAGRKVPVGGSWSVTPQAQLAYTSVDFDDFTDPFGATVSIDNGDSLKGRIGLALDYDAGAGTDRSHVYGIANLTYDFLDGTAVDVAGVNVAFEPDSFGAELGLGGTYRWAGGKYALYGEALASTSFEGSYGVKGTLGFSTTF